ncbi:helix-turn-helix transcriptional regulator [Rhizobium leguminosarum]|uniref:helix-turn-helix transcriptional regulator n=1 Tax=Rhizobium leguminosarum TaxID=384 RepID=UPI0021BBB9E9|nr:HTH domain-containing protein [Rhizobium leguminosarum]
MLKVHSSVLRARRIPVTALELGVSQRSVYRDIETLRLLGAPLDGQAGIGYRLREGFFLPHLAFSPDELDALILGLRWVQQRADPALSHSSDSALAKLLSARNDSPVSSDDPPALVTAASASERADPLHVAPLRDAIRRQCKSRSNMRMLMVACRVGSFGRSSSCILMMCAFWRSVRAQVGFPPLPCRSCTWDDDFGGALPGATSTARKALARAGSRLAFDPDSF